MAFKRQLAHNSTNIQSFGYDEEALIFEVVFNNNSVYWYYNVPKTAFVNCLASMSKGKFISKHIKGIYEFQKIK